MTDAAAPIAAAIIADSGRVLLMRRRVSEGTLIWQYPAGEVEPDERAEDAAVRETVDETGLVVRAVERLSERVHPTTGRTMIYVACDVVEGTAHVGAPEEVAEVAWCDRSTLTALIPSPLHAAVQEYLDRCLAP